MSEYLQFPQYAFSGDNRAKDTIILNEDDEEAERRHIEKVVNAFRNYRKYAYTRLNKTESYLSSLPIDDQNMLSKYRTHLECVRTCIDRNQAVIKEMMRQRVLYPTDKSEGTTPSNIRHQDMDHAQSTLKLIARDWSTDGAAEREQAYKPIIEAIEEFYQPDKFALNEVKILVPGAGLGRLLYELASRGYDCEGNEFSYFMLIASNFVLNQCDQENNFVLYPWVHQYVNNLHRADQVAAVRFPDVSPLKKPPKGNIMMAAGDFLEVYNMSNVYDCVATSFFIDCANNVIDFIRTIYKILVPGGIWVNLGPLLYHYSDINGENSIEPTFEDLIIIMENIGFNIVRQKTGVPTKYAQNPNSMQKSEYESLFWICRKPRSQEEDDLMTQEEQQEQQQHIDNEINVDDAEIDAAVDDNHDHDFDDDDDNMNILPTTQTHTIHITNEENISSTTTTTTTFPSNNGDCL